MPKADVHPTSQDSRLGLLGPQVLNVAICIPCWPRSLRAAKRAVLLLGKDIHHISRVGTDKCARIAIFSDESFITFDRAGTLLKLLDLIPGSGTQTDATNSAADATSNAAAGSPTLTDRWLLAKDETTEQYGY